AAQQVLHDGPQGLSGSRDDRARRDHRVGRRARRPVRRRARHGRGPALALRLRDACQVSWMFLAEDDAKPKSSMEPSPTHVVEARLLNTALRLTRAEAERLIEALMNEPEPAYIDEITALLLAGKAPRQILDVIQVASARVVLTVGSPANFSMP